MQTYALLKHYRGKSQVIGKGPLTHVQAMMEQARERIRPEHTKNYPVSFSYKQINQPGKQAKPVRPIFS